MPLPAQPLELRRSRGFSQQVNITVEFIRQNYRMLGRSILYIAGPSILLSGILVFIAWYLRDTMLPSMTRDGIFWSTALVELVQVFLLFIVTVFDICAVNAYVILYLRNGPGRFGIGDVWREARGWLLVAARILAVIGGMLLFIAFLCLILIAVGTSLTISIGAGIAAGTLYILVLISPLMTVRIYEDLYTSQAMNRCIGLVRGNRFLTFGIMGLFQLLVLLPSVLLESVSYLVTWLAEIDPYWTSTDPLIMALLLVLASASVMSLGFTQSVVVLASALHYFNLVEKKEGIRISERIGTIGAGEEHSAEESTWP